MTTVTTVTSGVGGGQGQMELWKASLCGCMDDCTSCCLTFWCPCFQYGFNKQATTGEGCCVPCCVYFLVVSLAWPVMPCIAASNRTTIRQVYNLPAQVRKGSQINRFVFAAMCPPLSLSLSSFRLLQDAFDTNAVCSLIFSFFFQPCDDCCVYCFCFACALCQEARELQLRDANAANPAINKLRGGQQQQMVVVTQAPQVVAAPAASAPATGEPAPVFKV